MERPARPSRRTLRVLVLALVLSLSLALGGCYDAKSVDSRSMVFAIAFDAAPQQEVSVSAEEVNPLGSPASPTGGQPTAQPTVTFSGTASSVSGALLQMQASAPKQLDLVNLGVVLFSEQMAQRGVQPIVNFLVRGSRARVLSWALVTQGPAAQVLDLRPQSGVGSSFRDLFQAQGGLGAQLPAILSEPVWKLFRDSYNREADPVLPLIRINDHKIVFDGAALFHDGHMTGTLTPQQAATLAEVTMSTPRGEIYIQRGQGRVTVLEITRLQASVAVTPGPGAEIRLSATARMIEATGVIGAPSLKFQDQVAQLAGAKLTSNVRSLYASLVKARCDALGLGKLLNAHQPRVWDALKANWPQEMAHVPLHVNVQVQISSPEI